MGTSTTVGGATTTASLQSALGDLANGDASTFVALLTASGLAGDLSSKQVTVLVPSNDAFKSMSATDLKALVSDATAAKNAVLNHLLDGSYSAADLAKMTSVTARSGRSLAITSAGGKLTIGGATVIKPDMKTGTITAHEIDRVLM
ncbi:MAG: fasciclin domain-containing protein [Acidimicrobiia bacterium]